MIEITTPSGRDAWPPVASSTMSAAPFRCASSHSSSKITNAQILPAMVSVSAAYTRQDIPVTRCVIVRMFGWMWNNALSSGSAWMASRMGLNTLSAVSFVGAMTAPSLDWRQLSTARDSISPATTPDFQFFFGTLISASRIRRSPVSTL